MALDEAILEAFIAGECLQTVRIYRWTRTCVTIGRNQDLEEARGPYPGVDIYRRPTGGRAVLHGDDLTVSVIADENMLRKQTARNGVLASYHHILAGVIDTFSSYGIHAVTGLTRKSHEDIDCFAAVGKCDIVDAETGSKIMGCAQYRSRGAILQQMSIRRHERYHIYDTDFIVSLRECLSRRLAVDEWEPAMSALPSEYSRSSL